MEEAEISSTSLRSRHSTDSDRPSSIPGPRRRSIEVLTQTSVHRGRRSPRTLHSDTFRSLGGSVASSPSPTTTIHKQSHLSSPLRQSLFQPPSDSPISRTTSRSTSNTPDPLQRRLILPPRPLSSVIVANNTSLDRVLRDHDSAVSETANLSDVDTLSERGMKNNDGAGDDVSISPATATLSHVLVNAIILQDFILEIAALVQLRACLWGEVEI